MCVYLLPSCRSLHLFLLKRAVSSIGTIVPMGLFPHGGENLEWCWLMLTLFPIRHNNPGFFLSVLVPI